MPTLATKDICTGCGACYNACGHSAITMKADAEGFLFPSIDAEKCVNCGLCERCCQFITECKEEKLPEQKVYAMWSNPDRTLSSSGGAFSAFARVILAKDGVVFGAAMDDELNCKHVEVNSLDELDQLRGSKYIQSNTGETYKRVKALLREGKYVLYTGTPCQIEGLKTYLHKPQEKLFTLDLVCHGVPSNSVFKSYDEKLRNKLKCKENLKYEFRRKNRWGKTPSVFTQGQFHAIYGVDALYMGAFNAAAIFRKSCYQCQFANTNRVGDITLADFWGIGRYGTPFKQSTKHGVSLIIVNTQEGSELLKETQDVFSEERTLEEALIENANLRQPSTLHPQRDEIVKAFLDPKLTLSDIDKEYHLVDHTIKAKIIEYATRLHVSDFAKNMYDFCKKHK